ncbi:Uncharacterized protein ChrSV_1733 [Chromobacterium vaccinii]|nr:Uncharacterized protein ChrSW_1733 [Chromobacterium vaccinii]QND89191.1 Uncharacterized protein ChrSV_1733 [Chromobacterium vaccinii]
MHTLYIPGRSLGSEGDIVGDFRLRQPPRQALINPKSV